MRDMTFSSACRGEQSLNTTANTFKPFDYLNFEHSSSPSLDILHHIKY